MSSLHLDHVNKLYGKVPAVRDVCLDVRDGEFLVLVGPSGCGKTTLLRLIAGLERGEGDIFIGERCVTGMEPRNRNVAMVFQGYALYPHMTVQGNLMFPLRMRKVPAGQAAIRAAVVADQLHLTPLLKRRPKQLSGGQRQRVALGRAMVRNPAVFLMDEPLSNLDANLRAEMRGELVALHKQLGATFVYVTHDLGEASALGDRMAVMQDGYIRQVGTPADVVRAPADAFVAAFVAGAKA